MIKAQTFVLVICKRRGENEGCSPAPTNATSDVQKSISTIPIPPSAIKIITV